MASARRMLRLSFVSRKKEINSACECYLLTHLEEERQPQCDREFRAKNSVQTNLVTYTNLLPSPNPVQNPLLIIAPEYKNIIVLHFLDRFMFLCLKHTKASCLGHSLHFSFIISPPSAHNKTLVFVLLKKLPELYE